MIRAKINWLLRRLSIRQKLMFITMASSMAALLLVAVAFLIFEYFTFRTTMQRDLATLAVITGDQSSAAVRFEDKDAAREILNRLQVKPGIEAAGLYLGTNAFVQYYFSTNKDLPAIPAHPGADGWHFQDGYLAGFQPIRQGGNPIGAIYLRSNLNELRSQLWSHAFIILFFTVGALLAAQLLATRLQRIISRPVFHLAETARLVSLGKNYALRASKESEDEIGQLIDGFNAMLAQIQERDGALKRANDELEKRVEERTRDLRFEITERNRAEVSLKEQFSRITLLNQITQAISERQNLGNILQVVLRQLEDHFAIAAGFVGLFEMEKQTLRIASSRIKNPLLNPRLDLHVDTLISLQEAGLGLCARGETVYLADTAGVTGQLAEKFSRAGLASVVAVPLLVENELFGVLIAARVVADAFSAGESEFLRTLSEHVALAAHQAQLHEQLEKAFNELRQTQQVVMQQERLKALGQMASGIAHDINNALSPVVGFADLVVEAERTMSEDSKRHMRYIRTAGEDIAHIVARLREFYRQRDEHESDSVLLMKPNSLVMQVVDMTRPRWRDIPQGNGIMIEVRTELDPDASEFAGLESEIREALTNLVINAVDAVPKGGVITIRTRAFEAPPGEVKNGAVKFVIMEVSDNGTGMDEATRRRCLEPFFSTKGRRGTGLGLAMVYGVLERHEGRIEIESEPGLGTTIRLIFPVRQITLPDPGAATDQQRPAPCRILCMDDEAPIRELLNDILKRDGHEVTVTDGAKAGLDLFRTASNEGRIFDVVITDLGMPYVDGREVAMIIKRESPSTPVIMLTGWGAFMKDDGTLPPHVDGILSKPPRLQEIRSMLQHLLPNPASPSKKPGSRRRMQKA
jgi:signal transduction histidine kinase/ActR/RegA family two-component response regulator/HAMP domain-containing protein